MSEQKTVKRYLINNTIQNIDNIARSINNGCYADKELMVKLINRMLAFLNEFVKLPKEVKDGKGIGGNEAEGGAQGVLSPPGAGDSSAHA
jgi:hypothetical protein